MLDAFSSQPLLVAEQLWADLSECVCFSMARVKDAAKASMKSLGHAIEVLLVGAFVFIWMISPIINLWLPGYLWFTAMWWLIPMYGLWMWWDWETPRRGARPMRFMRDNVLWRLFASYFPLRLVKTADLPPDRNYIVGSHPHGVLSIGGFISLITEATGFSSLFPGITANVMTLNGQFWFPGRRDFGLAVGGCESSRHSLRWLLKNPGTGRAIGIVLGGLNEALMARPGRHDLKILNRRGFCRFALQFGADLVPMYHFGETDLYDQAAGQDEQLVKNMQARIRNAVGFCPPLLIGRSILGLPWGGILPYRRPVTSVAGAPIRVERVDQPTEEQIDDLHRQYVGALVDLFEEHKLSHGVPDDVHINLF